MSSLINNNNDNNNDKDKSPITLPFQTSYTRYPLQLSSSTSSLTLNILYPPLSLTLFTKKIFSCRLVFKVSFGLLLMGTFLVFWEGG